MLGAGPFVRHNRTLGAEWPGLRIGNLCHDGRFFVTITVRLPRPRVSNDLNLILGERGMGS